MQQATVFTPAQQHVLKMMSFSKSEDSINELRSVLASYYAQKVQAEADALWESGELNEDSINNILNEHLRTPYKSQK